MNEDPIDAVSKTIQRYKKAIDDQNALIRQMKEEYKSGNLENLNSMLEKLKKHMSVFKELSTE